MCVRLCVGGTMLALATMILALLLVSTRAFAQADKLQVVMTRVTPATVTQGEPIVLHYVITNNSNQKMTVDMGLDGALTGTEWVTPRLTAADGTTVPALTDPIPRDPGGLHFSTAQFGPNSQKAGDLVITRWFSIPHPGTYQLTVRVNLPYQTWIGNEASSQRHSTDPIEFTQDFTFPLTITAPNPQRLQALAVSLEHAASQSKDLDQQIFLVRELASLPEAQAWPGYVKLMKDAPSLTGLLIPELGRRPTKHSVDLLAQMIWTAKTPSEQFVAYGAGPELGAIYNQSAGGFKEYIRQIYANHGVDLTNPNQIYSLHNGG